MWTNNSTTMSAPSIAELSEMARKFQAEQKRIDDGLIDALLKYADPDNALAVIKLAGWLGGMSPFDLQDYLKGKRPLPASLWDRVRAWTENAVKPVKV